MIRDFLKKTGIFVTAALFGAAAVIPTFAIAKDNTPASGWNDVIVESCSDNDGGVWISRTANGPQYQLENGTHDTGHGLRTYHYQCVSNTSYRVSWTPSVQPEYPTATPTIISSVADAVLTNFPRTLTVSWQAVPHADSYELEVACDTCVSTTHHWGGAQIYSTNTPSLALPALPGDNQYRIRVRAVGGTSFSPWSNFTYFRFKTETPKPATPSLPLPNCYTDL